MILQSGYVVEHIPHNHPSFLLIPFQVENIILNATLKQHKKDDLLQKLASRYPDKAIGLTLNGRSALKVILEDIGISSVNDEVAIFTTSGNSYISGCVTKTIDETGSWIREKITSRTKAILVNHEFGYPCEKIEELKKYGLPIIEDCAYSFNSKYKSNELVGTTGDYAIFSFSKYFPIQIGGFFLAPHKIDDLKDDSLCNYISSVVMHNWNEIEAFSNKRLDNFTAYISSLKNLPVQPFFTDNANAVPGVFLFHIDQKINLQDLKNHFWNCGIQCSIFYGKHAFFLPIHQYINKEVIVYFSTLLNNYLNEHK